MIFPWYRKKIIRPNPAEVEEYNKRMTGFKIAAGLISSNLWNDDVFGALDVDPNFAEINGHLSHNGRGNIRTELTNFCRAIWNSRESLSDEKKVIDALDRAKIMAIFRAETVINGIEGFRVYICKSDTPETLYEFLIGGTNDPETAYLILPYIDGGGKGAYIRIDG